MTRYEFCDTEEAKEKIQYVPVEKILNQHRRRFIMQTENCGTIVLRYLPKRVKKNIDAIRIFRFPDCTEIEAELTELDPIVKHGEATEEMHSRYWELWSLLTPSLDLYMMGTIEYPFLNNMDEVDSLLEALTEEERSTLRQAHEILSSHAPAEVDVEYLSFGDRFRCPVVDKNMLDNMTLQQYEVLYAVMKNEESEMRKMYKNAGVKI